jgi:hypothetical protein
MLSSVIVPSADAIERCTAKSLRDGTIVVSASGVVGVPRWGTRHGEETSSFDGSATCVAGSKLKSCALAPTGDPARTRPPASCTLYLADAGGPGCSTWVKRCLPSSEPPACAILPANNIWNRDISTLPVHAMSSTWVATIGAGSPLHPDFGAPYRGRAIGIPYVNVGTTQPLVPVSFTYADESDPGPYPIPPLVPVEGGGPLPSKGRGDAHVLVVQQDTCTLYETFASKRLRNGASWSLGSGAVYDLSSNALRPDGFTSADAAGLPILPGLVRFDEVAGGAITHALRFTAPSTQRAYVWPARHYASSITDPSYPPMGIRVRLKASVDISGFSAVNQVILTALKKYGMFLADNGSSWFVSGAPDDRWDNDELHALTQLRGSDFEVVDESSLMVDPDSGEAAP